MDKLIEIEDKRIEALKNYAILDSESEDEFDEITALAAEIADAPIALISFIDEKRQWVKSSFGIKISEIPREDSYCSIAINSIDEPLIINDALSDPHFAKTPHYLNNKLIAFYIGIPLVDSNKNALGTLSIIDFKSREISSKDLKSLQTIAKGVMRLLELRKTQENSFLEQEKINKALDINNSFYLILNSNFEITSIGKSFNKAIPELTISSKITDYLALEFDIISEIEKAISGKSKILFFSSKGKVQRFKCSIGKINTDFVISAQPIINEIFPLKNYNITLNDFSQHDSIIEYLFLQQTAQKSLKESRSLVDEASKRNFLLEEQKKLIEQNQKLLKENLLKEAIAKERYSNLVHATNDLILNIDKSGAIVFVNNSWLKKMGYSNADVIGNSIFNYVHPDSQEHCALFFQDLMTNSLEQLDVNYSLINRHGQKVEVEGTIICKYEHNEFSAVNSFLKDVTEINILKRIEEEKTKEVLKNKEKLEAVMDSLTETVWGVSLPDYKSEYISNSALDLYGIPLDSWINNPNTWFEAIHPDDIERVERENSVLFPEGFSELEYRIVTPKNEVKWIQTRTKIIKNGDGIPYLMTGIAADITKRKKLEFELIENKEKLEVVMDSLTGTVWGISLPDYKVEYLSNSVLDLYGISVENWIKNSNSWSDSIHPEDAERVERENSVLFSEGFTDLEYRIVTSENEVKWIQSRTRIINNGDGIPYLMTGIAEDITQRKKLEFELINYRKALDSAAIVSITDEKGIISYTNENFCEISKYSAEELIGKNHNILNSGYHSKEFFQEMWQTISSGNIWKGEIKNKAKDGSEYFVESSIIPFMKEGKPYQYISIRFDSTEKVISKQKNEDQKQFYEFILNNIPSDIAVFSPDHKYLFLNPIAIKNTELRNFMIGKDDFDYCEFKGIDNSLAIERRKAFNELVANKEFVEWEDEKILDNGQRHISLRKMGPIYNDEGELLLVIGYGLEITSRKIAEENVEIAKKEVEHINLNLKSLVQDATRKNLELSQTLNDSEKLATIGEMASGIAHDLNTPLSSIKNGAEAVRYTIDSIFNDIIWKCSPEQISFAIKRSIENKSEGFIRGIQQMIMLKEFKAYLSENYKQLAENEISEFASAFVKARIELNETDLIATILNNSNALDLIKLIDNLQTTWKFIDSIVVSSDRAANVVNDLRSIIKNQKSLKSQINIHDNISTVLNIFDFEFKKNINIEFNVDNSSVIYGYDIRLFQLWSNIIKNAIEAMVRNDGRKLLKISSIENKESITISIENNGAKIPEDVLEKIFDKFYSSKSGNNKSGLGLSIVKNIIAEHNAEIKVTSTEISTIFAIIFSKNRYE